MKFVFLGSFNVVLDCGIFFFPKSLILVVLRGMVEEKYLLRVVCHAVELFS